MPWVDVLPSVAPVDLTLRDLTPADVPAWSRLLAAAEAVDDTAEHYNEADLLEELDNPDLVPGGYVGAFDGEDLVGYLEVRGRAPGEDYLKIATGGTTRPDRRGEGIGSVLVTHMLERADAVHRARHPHGPARVLSTGLTTNTAQEALLGSAGLRPHRWSFGMRVQLADVGDPAPLPDGLRLQPYTDALAEAMLEAHNDAFLDHPDFTAWTAEEWKQWVTGSRNFRPALSRVVVDPAEPDRVLAYVQSNEYDAHAEATGRREAYVAKVGVRREVRGRGVATALLQHCLLAYRDAGLDEASLDVDSENPTGALGVYQRAGFAVERRWTDYLLERPPLS